MFDKAKAALGLKEIKQLDANTFALPPLESCNDGLRDLENGDKYAFFARWDTDAGIDWQRKYADLAEWIKANITAPEFSFDLNEDPVYDEDSPFLDEIFRVDYQLTIRDNAEARLFKAKWC